MSQAECAAFDCVRMRTLQCGTGMSSNNYMPNPRAGRSECIRLTAINASIRSVKGLELLD
jgi:hypothetical protein